MGLFVSSKASATRHGVYAIEKTPPAVIAATGFGTAAMVEQLPWGPSQVLTSPTSKAELLLTIAPPGMTRTGSGYLSVIRKGFPFLKFVRVLGSTAVTASAAINKTGPTLLFTVALKYPGTEGNAVVITTSAASDGDANHFNITASVTGASGTTTDLIENYNLSGTGADTALTTADLAKLRLIGSITKSSSGVPILGSTTCTGGTNGTIDATTYVGTQGANDKGVAKLEGSKGIDHFFCGDPGNSIRAAVNAGFKSHADYMSDRCAYLNGNSANTATQAQTDVANYRSQRVVYCDPWVYLYDDVTGAKTLVTSAAFAASVASQLSPSTKIAWKSDEVISMLGGIVDLEADRGEATSTNTTAGIATFIREEDGGFTIEADPVTIAPTTPAKKSHTRTRMGHYIARSITKSLRSSVDAPNVPVNQQDCVDAVTTFMEVLKGNAGRDPNHTPHVLDYGIGDLDAENPQASKDDGDFSIPLDVKTSSGMSRIFLSFNYGETVTVTAQ
jgi:phage tail sheath protein FI